MKIEYWKDQRATLCSQICYCAAMRWLNLPGAFKILLSKFYQRIYFSSPSKVRFELVLPLIHYISFTSPTSRTDSYKCRRYHKLRKMVSGAHLIRNFKRKILSGRNFCEWVTQELTRQVRHRIVACAQQQGVIWEMALRIDWLFLFSVRSISLGKNTVYLKEMLWLKGRLQARSSLFHVLRKYF